MKRRNFLSAIAAIPLCIHGWKLSDNPECEPAPPPVVCARCGESGHKHEIVEIRTKHMNWEFGGFRSSRSFAMICKNRQVNWDFYERV